MPPLPPSFDAPAELDWDRPLYSSRQVAWVAGFGGALGGGWILGLTLGRIGRARQHRPPHPTLKLALPGRVTAHSPALAV
jgi:hypothetical protein